jgi:hypothetical protein
MAVKDRSAHELAEALDRLVQSGPGFQTFVTTVAELLATRPLSEEAARRATP